MFSRRNKKSIYFAAEKKKQLEMCPQYTDAPAVGYLTIKLQNSTWYKCLNLSLTRSHMYVRTHIRTEGRTLVCMYPRTHIRKIEKLYAPGIIRCRGIKTYLTWSHNKIMSRAQLFKANDVVS